MEAQDQQQDKIPFEFTGTATQFFGIWIVNILLIIITLGLYLPWAKVRTQRFFHGNTLLDDAPFDYLASPIAILKGWAIALLLFIVYSVVTEAFPITVIFFLPLLVLVTPWIVVRALGFRMRNTAWQNIRFGFSTAYRDAAGVFIGWFTLSILSLGLLYPWFRFEASRFVVNNTSYGTTPFRFQATVGDFYKIYAKAALLPLLVIVVLLALAFPQLKKGVELFQSIQQETEEQAEVPEETTTPEPTPAEEFPVEEDLVDEASKEAPVATAETETGATPDAADLAVEPVIDTPAEMLQMSEAPVIETLPAEELPSTEIIEEEATPVVTEAIEATDATEVTVAEVTPAIEETEETATAVVEETVTEETESTPEEKPGMATFALMFAAMFFGLIAAYMAMFIYISARTTNLVYNSTEIAGHRFESRVRARDLFWLYLSNLVLILLSFGLLVPWAQVRLARYRASKLMLLPKGSLDEFMQAQSGQVNAIGEEIGEAFDIDVGL